MRSGTSTIVSDLKSTDRCMPVIRLKARAASPISPHRYGCYWRLKACRDSISSAISIHSRKYRASSRCKLIEFAALSSLLDSRLYCGIQRYRLHVSDQEIFTATISSIGKSIGSFVIEIYCQCGWPSAIARNPINLQFHFHRPTGISIIPR